MSTYTTTFGPVYYDGTGNDHRSNLVNFIPKFSRRHEAVKLQRPALKAWQEAERRYGRRIAERNKWKWKRRSRAIPVTGSWRSFDLQYSLWKRDSRRFASPYGSGHVQGIAVDVNNELEDFELIQDILLNVGWEQARSDERWHFSWGLRV